MPRKGESPTPAQMEALKRGKAKRDAALKNRDMTKPTRWSMLLDGTLTVRDLDDEEIKRGRTRGRSGQFEGKAPRLPSHLHQAFHSEAIRRANDRLRTAAPEAVKALLDIGSDPDVKESDRIKALMYVVDRALGKAPQTVRIEGDAKFDKAVEDAFVDRDVDSLIERAILEDGQA